MRDTVTYELTVAKSGPKFYLLTDVADKTWSRSKNSNNSS